MAAVQPDLEYIKKSGIGKVMAQALGSMYKQEPKFPIDYLVAWLRNYMEKNEYKQSLEHSEQLKEDGHQKFVKHSEQLRLKQLEEKQLEAQKAESLKQLKEEITKIEYHADVIEALLPKEVFSRVEATSVYIGLYTFRKVDLEENDDNEIGHMNFDLPKAIRFVGGLGKNLVDNS